MTGRKAPAALWHYIRSWLGLVSTDFYYNWTTALVTAAATRYDIFISGSHARHAAMKIINPNGKFIPYVLQYTCMQPSSPDAVNLATKFSADQDAWSLTHGVSAADQEAMWLHTPDGARAVEPAAVAYGNARWIPDPRSVFVQQYTVDRFRRLCAESVVDGLFIDEMGSGTMNGVYKYAMLTTADRTAVQNAETVLLGMIADAMYPKQLVINLGNYMFAWDEAMAKAALGAHLEQLNAPLSVDLAGSAWPFVRRLLASGVFVNFVPIYTFGGYEKQHDRQTPPNYMDTPRGKLLEVASAYMCVSATDPSLLALHLENGPWGNAVGVLPSAMTNYVPQVDANLGKPLEDAQRPSGTHSYRRRFERGLVVFNPVYVRDPDPFIVGTSVPLINFGPSNATTITLPTDRKYAQVKADGTLAPPSPTITLRTPEAALFQVVP